MLFFWTRLATDLCGLPPSATATCLYSLKRIRQGNHLRLNPRTNSLTICNPRNPLDPHESTGIRWIYKYQAHRWSHVDLSLQWWSPWWSPASVIFCRSAQIAITTLFVARFVWYAIQAFSSTCWGKLTGTPAHFVVIQDYIQAPWTTFSGIKLGTMSLKWRYLYSRHFSLQ